MPIATSKKPITAILGCQWGDEGKGKLVDILAPKFSTIVRASGGANAGHTIYFRQVKDIKKIIFHLIPSGIIHPKTNCVIGNGCVIHLPTLMSELADLHKSGISTKGRLFISNRAHLLFEYHKIIDGLQENKKGQQKIGKT